MASALTVPTLYEHYASPIIHSGLSANQSYFTLNEKNITLYSGAMHYFRVPKKYWRDRLRKMRAAGLNTVETYVPWNLHEPQNGTFDFGHGGSDMEDFLDINEFLTIAKEEDLLAIVRPGPYICAEWEFGGFPSWLLRKDEVKLRTSEKMYISQLTRYFNLLLPILALLQFTKGGPIVAFQIENEYGTTESAWFKPDMDYLKTLREIFVKNGIVELLVTSDNPSLHGSAGTIPSLFLQTANFAKNPIVEFDKVKELQRDKPMMVMEFWSGWFDHWSECHNTRENAEFKDTLEDILKYPASVNFYMFHGGTNWGFLSGGNLVNEDTDNSNYQPITTSYDYDSPLSEAGDYTEKFFIIRELLKKYNNIPVRLPSLPPNKTRIAYSTVPIVEELLLDGILGNPLENFAGSNRLPVERLPLNNNNSGQSYGYTVYRKENLDIPANAILQIDGHVCDTVVVLVNGVLMSKPLFTVQDLDGFGFWRVNNSKLTLGPKALAKATLDLVVENWGRINYGSTKQFRQFKGLWQGDISINQKVIPEWQIFPLEFKKSWNKKLTGWHAPTGRWATGPSLHKAIFTVTEPTDTYVNMEQWIKGIVIINDFVLGRYSRIGPQQRLYLPAPFLKSGNNTIIVFESYIPSTKIRFEKDPLFRTEGRHC